MEEESPSEISIAVYRSMRRHKPGQLNIHQQQCEKFMFGGTRCEMCASVFQEHFVRQWRTERGGLGCSNPSRNSEDIGGVLDRMSKKSRRLDFLL